MPHAYTYSKITPAFFPWATNRDISSPAAASTTKRSSKGPTILLGSNMAWVGFYSSAYSLEFDNCY